MEETKAWFESWFNTPYYHILYAHRNDTEARAFIDLLVQTLAPAPGLQLLDVGCGKGRHSNYFAQKGFRVHGIDLSPENIRYAQEHALPGTRFSIRDMRHINERETCDWVVNLFTSFGYFDSAAENRQVLQQIYNALKPGGTFIFDYLNPHFVRNNLHQTSYTEKGNIQIRTRKSEENGYVRKEICVSDGGKDLRYEEKVKLLEPELLRNWLTECGFRIAETWGDYMLNPLLEQESPRSVFVALK